MKLLRFLSVFYTLNPRWLYLALVVVLVFPLMVRIPLPASSPSHCVRQFYDMVGSCPTGKVILIDSSWDQGSKPENMPQMVCLVSDMCRRKVRFVVFSCGMYSPTFAMQVIEPIAQKAGYQYGRDWVNLGFIQPPGGSIGVLIDALFRDLQGTRPTDIYGTPLDKIPLMQGVRSYKDIHMVCSIAYTPPVEWMSFGFGQYGVPVAFAAAAIMAPYYYTFQDSGQLCGLLGGIRGASEYESLAGKPGLAGKVMVSFAFGHVFIILAVVMGNVGAWACHRMRRTP